MSGTEHLYKKHSRRCTSRGKHPTDCDCPWWAKYRGHAIGLGQWSGQTVDPYTKGRAEEALHRFVAAVDARTFRKEGEQATIAIDETLGEYIPFYKREWVERRHLSRESLYPMLDVIVDGLGAYSLRHLASGDGPPLIEKWLNTQQELRGWSNATWNDYRSLFRRLFSRARRWNRMQASSPIDFIDPRIEERNKPKVRIDEEGERRLIAACPKLNEVQVRRNRSKITWEIVEEIRRRSAEDRQADIARDLGLSQATVSEIVTGKTWDPNRADHYTAGVEMYRRVAGGLDLGLRRTEMSKVTIDMVDFIPAIATVDGTDVEILVLTLPPSVTKGGKRTGLVEKVYAGTERVKKILLERREALRDNPPGQRYVFGTESGHRVADWSRSAKRLFELAGLRWSRNERLVWHTMRAEFICRTLEKSNDLTVAQAMARHKDTRTTQTYLSARPARLLETAARLDQDVKEGPPPRPGLGRAPTTQAPRNPQRQAQQAGFASAGRQIVTRSLRQGAKVLRFPSAQAG